MVNTRKSDMVNTRKFRMVCTWSCTKVPRARHVINSCVYQVKISHGKHKIISHDMHVILHVLDTWLFHVLTM